MKYAVMAGGLVLAATGAAFVGVTQRAIDPRLACLADIALPVLLSLLGPVLLFWRYDALGIPSRSFFEVDGSRRRDWHGLLVIAAIVGLGVMMIGIEILKCLLIGGHM